MSGAANHHQHGKGRDETACRHAAQEVRDILLDLPPLPILDQQWRPNDDQQRIDRLEPGRRDDDDQAKQAKRAIGEDPYGKEIYRDREIFVPERIWGSG